LNELVMTLAGLLSERFGGLEEN